MVEINKITGRNDNKIPVTSSIDPNEINSFFHDISTDPYYTAPELEEIQEGTRVPMLYRQGSQSLEKG